MSMSAYKMSMALIMLNAGLMIMNIINPFGTPTSTQDMTGINTAVSLLDFDSFDMTDTLFAVMAFSLLLYTKSFVIALFGLSTGLARHYLAVANIDPAVSTILLALVILINAIGAAQYMAKQPFEGA